MSGQHAGWIPAPDFTEVNAALAKIANQLRGARMYGSAEIEEIKAQAWDEGRESFAADLLRPLTEIGTRESSTNPYRNTK